MYPTIGYLGATALALADLIMSAVSKDRDMTFTLLNRLAIGLASVSRALDAGPGNTNGQPLSVAWPATSSSEPATRPRSSTPGDPATGLRAADEPSRVATS